jgi:capsular exopolysaccharide synthesis family protein
MDDLENKNNSNTNSAGENHRFNPDPIVQARDDSGKSADGIQPAEIMPIAKKPVPVVDATLLPNQFMRMGSIRQAAPSSTELLASILRFKWTILAVFVLVAAPAIAVIWTQVIPKYRARAEVRVRPIIPHLVFRLEDNGMIPLYGSFLNTQVSIIRGLTILQRVLDRKDVRETQWFNKPQQSLFGRLRGNPNTPIERLNDTLSVRPRSRTEIIDVSFMDSSVEDAKLIVNAVLDEYIQYIGEQTNAEEDKLYQQLTEQYRSLQTQIQGQEAATAALSKSLGTETPQELISSKRLRLDETQARLSNLRQQIAVLEWEIKQTNTDDSNNITAAAPAETIERQSKYYEDAEWLRLDANVRTIRHNIDTSLRTDKHPDSIRAQKDLALAEEALKLRETQLVKYQLARAKHEEDLLVTEFEKQQAEFINLFDTAQSLDKQNKSLRHMHELFDAVRQRLEQKNMERNVPGSIEVSMRAFASSRPYNDRRIVFTAMSLLLALGVGGGLAFLRAGRNQAVYTSRDMPHSMQAPLLGYIPVTRIRRKARGGKSLYEEIMRSRSHMIESVRIVRTVLLSRLNGQSSTTLLITSSDAGTGKTSFTMMLGKSLAQAGKKVLMIDSDLHKMSLTKQFELSDKSGLKESLGDSSTDQQYVFSTNTPGLSIMPVGNKGNDDTVFEQTANGAFRAFIGELHQQYDIILLDSPPILALADAVILSGQVDGTIIVERELVSRRANIIEALARLDSAGGCVLGTVFIGSSEHEKYGYGYHYSNYSNYSKTS